MNRAYGHRVSFKSSTGQHSGVTILGCTIHSDGKVKPFKAPGTIRIKYREKNGKLYECQMPLSKVKFVTTTEQLKLL